MRKLFSIVMICALMFSAGCDNKQISDNAGIIKQQNQVRITPIYNNSEPLIKYLQTIVKTAGQQSFGNFDVWGLKKYESEGIKYAELNFGQTDKNSILLKLNDDNSVASIEIGGPNDFNCAMHVGFVMSLVQRFIGMNERELQDFQREFMAFVEYEMQRQDSLDPKVRKDFKIHSEAMKKDLIITVDNYDGYGFKEILKIDDEKKSDK